MSENLIMSKCKTKCLIYCFNNEPDLKRTFLRLVWDTWNQKKYVVHCTSYYLNVLQFTRNLSENDIIHCNCKIRMDWGYIPMAWTKVPWWKINEQQEIRYENECLDGILIFGSKSNMNANWLPEKPSYCKIAHKRQNKFDYTTIADWFQIINWNDDTHLRVCLTWSTWPTLFLYQWLCNNNTL